MQIVAVRLGGEGGALIGATGMNAFRDVCSWCSRTSFPFSLQ